MPIFDPGIFDSGIFDTPSGGGTVTRTASDSVTTSDSAVRIGTFARTASDTQTTSDTTARTGAFSRSTSDSPTFSDSATASIVFIRTAADTRTTSDAASRVVSAARTAAQTITTSDSAARSGSFARTPSDTVTIYDAAGRYLSTVAPGTIYSASPSLDPVIRYGIVITFDGTDITDDVVIEEAEFVSIVNGQVGSCLLKVRDPNRDKSFTTGKRITLDILGNRVWTGYLSSVQRAYAFESTSPLTRFLILRGADINILLKKRITFKQSAPTSMFGPTYAPITKDSTAIAELVANWLDLSGDDLETGAYVQNVGDINIDQNANVWQAGWDWGSALSTIARLTQAIYYIDPSRNLVFTDVDTPNAPYGMSDTPGVGEVGYREMAVLYDGASMVNDALIWGVGGGSPTPVFKRETDATSISTHGTWQFGQTNSGVYKQATLNKIADSIVNGSPLSKRGAKDDRVSAEITTFTNGFLPAQKIAFESNVFGFSDVIPVRRMAVTFPGGNPRYRLALSHEIDLPFSPIDVINYHFAFPPINLPGIDIPPIEIPGEECDCGITDSFTRVVADGWGTSDIGLLWVDDFGGGRTSVDGSVGIADWPDSASPRSAEMVLPYSALVPVAGTIDFKVTTIPVTGNPAIIEFELPGTGTGLFQASVTNQTGGGTNNNGWLRFGSVGTPLSKTDWVADTWYTMRFLYSSTLQALKVWERASAEPGSWDMTRDPSSDAFFTLGLTHATELLLLLTRGGETATGLNHIEIDNLDITDVNRCTEYRFDNFNRTGTGGWGTSDSGAAWTYVAGTLSTNGTFGRSTSLTDEGITHIESPVWRETTGFEMTMRFAFSQSIPLNGAANDIYIFNPVSGHSVGIELAIGSDGEGTAAYIEVFRYTGSFTRDRGVFSTWESGAWYQLRWENRDGLSRLKVWKESSGEPGVWGVSRAIGPTDDAITQGATSELWVELEARHAPWSIDYIDFDYDTKPCYLGGPVPTGSTSTSATHFCEDLAADGIATVYTLERSYAAGTTEVYDDGFRIAYGVDYTETSAVDGTITFASAPSGTVRVCYRVTSDTGGYYIGGGGAHRKP